MESLGDQARLWFDMALESYLRFALQLMSNGNVPIAIVVVCATLIAAEAMAKRNFASSPGHGVALVRSFVLLVVVYLLIYATLTAVFRHIEMQQHAGEDHHRVGHGSRLLEVQEDEYFFVFHVKDATIALRLLLRGVLSMYICWILGLVTPKFILV